MRNKKHLVPFFVLIIIFSGVAFPTKRAHAQLFTIDVVQNAIKTALNTAAHTLQRAIVNQLVQSTVTWANSGFEGNPQYNVNLQQSTLNAANNSAVAFITGLGQNPALLCAPFKNNVTISLRNYYTNKTNPANPSFQCTFTGIANNLTNSYSNFSSSGGWNTWFAMTQVPSNNPYDVYLAGTQQIDSKVSASVTVMNQKFQANAGFLDVTPCLAKNPDQATMNKIAKWQSGADVTDITSPDYDASAALGLYIEFDENVDTDYGALSADQASGKIDYNSNIPAGGCIAHGDVETPGTVIAKQLNDTVGSGLSTTITAQDWDQVVSALITGLTKRIFTSATGLFTKSSSPTAGLPTGGGTVAPTAILYASPSSLATGGTSTLTWTSSNAASCSAPWTASTATSGSQIVTVSGMTTYSIGCTDGTNTTSAQATITVTPTGGSVGGGGGGSSIACSVGSQVSEPNDDLATWSLTSGLSGTVDYEWQGDNITSASTYNSALGYATGPSITVTYTTGGTKNMEVTASTTDASGLQEFIGPVSCQPVSVFDGLINPAT